MKLLALMVILACSTTFANNKSLEDKVSISYEVSENIDEKDKQIVFNIMNDLFAPNNMDRHLTNSIEIGYISDRLPQFLSWYDEENSDEYFMATVSQEMYTPEDIEASELIENDRPYAGWTFLRFVMAKKEDGNIQMTFLDFGVIGEHSLAEQAQVFIHDLIDTRDPNGWDNQLENEKGINFSHLRARNFRVDYEDIGADITPFIGASVGNIKTGATIGATARFGLNLPENSIIAYNEPSNELSLYFSTTLMGSHVARDIFIDGNTFQSSHSLRREPFIGRASFSIALGYGDFELSYSYNLISKQFEGQDGHDSLGSFKLNYKKQF